MNAAPDLPPPGPSTRRPGRRAVLIAAALGVALVTGAAALAHRLVLDRGLAAIEDTAGPRMELAAARLEAALARFDVLPSLLAASADVGALLAAPADPARREAVNRHLASLNAIAGADMLYLLDASGQVVASDAPDDPASPYGRDLSYRPYFREALAGGQGRFYGVGVTSQKAGYYLAYRLAVPARERASAVVGVATVKVDLERTEQDWRETPGQMLVLDEHRVVILSSEPAWRFHPLAPLPPAERSEAEQARRYGRADLSPLDWRAEPRRSARSQPVRAAGVAYLASERPLNHGRWQMVLLDEVAPAQTAARAAALSAALATLVALLCALLWRQRRRARLQRQAGQAALQLALQAARDSLERKVEERTAELRAAQDELVHAGKLAVLGQLSAGMVHEFNQPLAAMRTLADNAVMLIERERVDDARGNLARIGRLVERLGRLTNQLKVFAYRSAEAPVPVSVRHAIDESIALVAQRLRDAGVELRIEVQPPALSVAAEPVRLEQVIGNLVGNAIDAMQAVGSRRLELEARADGDTGRIVVRNSGPPIDPEVLARLFEPFVTSKPVGRGLGLGLMISSHLVRQYGGTLRARNLPAGGVEFTIELPLATLAVQEAPTS